MAAKKQTVTLAFERATKNTFRFSTEDETAAITTLYVSKDAEIFDGLKGEPKEITVTLEAK